MARVNAAGARPSSRYDARMLRIETLPLLQDNYGYLLVDDERREAVVVDPSEAAPVKARAAALGVRIVGIWCTHHHGDHVGGVEELVGALGAMPVVGSVHDAQERRIARQTAGVDERSELSFGGEHVRVLEIPGHTLGAIAYVVGGAVFSGDTLFLSGCGRVFEGTMPQMRASLAKLRALPESTRVFPGHEYTVKNLEFALMVEAQSAAVRARLDDARARRARGVPTVPGTMAEELATNPFLRWDAATVQQRVGLTDPDEVFAHLRRAKDRGSL